MRNSTFTGTTLSLIAATLALAAPVQAEAVSGGTDVTEQARNRQVVEAHYAALNAGDLDGALAAFAPMVTNHGRTAPKAILRLILHDIKTRFPDAHSIIDEIVAVDNYVIVRQTVSGTHLGVGTLPVDGGLMVGVPPTGKKFTVQHIHWYTLKDGLIVEHRANRDDIGMMVQLGLLPAPPPFEIPKH